MSYADGLLATGEVIEHREKQHWWVFVWGAKFTILALILAVVLWVVAGSLSTDGFAGAVKTLLGWVTLGLFVFAIGILIWTTLQYLSQEYVLTNRRVIQVSGVVNKTAVDSSLEKINDAVLKQSVFGRALGFGDLEILTASESGISDFHMLMRPIEFKKAMLDAKHRYEMEVAGSGRVDSPPIRATAPVAAAAEPAAPPAPRTDPDATVSSSTPGAPAPGAADPDEIARTLSSLADLRDRGAISPEEYDRKKAELLGRL
jgi:uncharacterized membrane protein YdbT with pleckstrin-like domain